MELVEREAGHVDGYQWFVSSSFTITIYFVLIQIPNSTLLDQHWFFDIKGQENFKIYFTLCNQKSRCYDYKRRKSPKAWARGNQSKQRGVATEKVETGERS